MALPPEILDHILSFLQSDPAALKSCSESHPSLSQLAEPYLYAHVLLRTDDESQLFKPENLTELLSKRPYIVYYIRSLEIDVRNGHDKETRRCCLEEISTILPNLSALREITLDHSSSPGFGWEAQPESFRRAFLDCFRSQTMQDVHVKHVLLFPFRSALNGECSIRSLTVRGGLWQRSNPNQINNLDSDGPFMNQGIPLKSLCIQLCGEEFLHGFVPWFATCRPQLHSLEFFSLDDRGYDSLPRLLTSSSNSLTSLDLNVELASTRYYDFKYPIAYYLLEYIPVTLSILPRLEQLTLRGVIHYIAKSRTTTIWGCYSPIPAIITAIMRLFSSNTSCLKHLSLPLDCTVDSEGLVQTDSLPWSSLSEVICTPLVQLLSTISAFECPGSSSTASIQVDLLLGGEMTANLSHRFIGKAIPLPIIHSILSRSKELMQFVEQGRLIITPPVPTSFNINVLDCW